MDLPTTSLTYTDLITNAPIEAPGTTVLLRFKHSLTTEQINERAAGLTRRSLTHPQLAGVSLVVKHVVEPSGAWRVSLSLSDYFYLRNPSGAVSRFWTVNSALVLRSSASGALLVQRQDGGKFNSGFCDPQDVEFTVQITAHQMIKSAIDRSLGLDVSRSGIELGGTMGDLVGPVKYGSEQNNRDYTIRIPGEAADAVTKSIVQITSRCPQLADLMPPELADKAAQSPEWSVSRAVPIRIMPYVLGTSDMREVTRRLFGKKRVTKPLVRICTQLIVERSWFDTTVIWARLFRGLVPIEDITAWLEQAAQNKHWDLPGLSKKHQDQVRAVLRELPQPVVRRLLARPNLETAIGLSDMARGGSRLDTALLGEVVRLRGHRNIRTVNDLEQLAKTLPKKESISDRRARLAAERRESVRLWIRVCEQLRAEGERTGPTWQQWQDPQTREQLTDRLRQIQLAQREERERIRAEQAELRRQERMAQETEKVARTAQLQDPMNRIRIGQGKDQLKVVVAKDPETLARWGSQMGHCIANYDIRIGLETMFAVVDAQGTVLVNGHINNDHLIQLYSKHNKPAKTALSQEHLDQLLSAIEELGVNTQNAAGLL